MRRITTSLAAAAFILTLATAAHAQPGGHGHTGHGGFSGGKGGNIHPGKAGNIHPGMGNASLVKGGGFNGGSGHPTLAPKGPSAAGTFAKAGHFGGFKGTARAGKNHSYRHRPGHWGGRVWCAACACWCYWDGDADCYYYWCEPDQCYYPLSYCPYGRYDYTEPE